MHVILYASEYAGNSENVDNDLTEIVKVAKDKNHKYSITGALFFHNNRFMRIIEGPQDDLKRLMAHIHKDRRHTNIQELVNEPITEKSFSAWNMDVFNLSKKEDLDFDELMKIRDMYKHNFVVKSDLLVEFYKGMLESHDLQD